MSLIKGVESNYINMSCSQGSRVGSGHDPRWYVPTACVIVYNSEYSSGAHSEAVEGGVFPSARSEDTEEERSVCLMIVFFVIHPHSLGIMHRTGDCFTSRALERKASCI